MGFAADIETQFAQDLAAAIVDQSSVLEHEDDEVTGTCSPTMSADDVSPLGTLRENDIEWVGLVADFTTVPANRAVVQVDEIKYTVMSVENDGTILRLELKRQAEQ